MGFGETVTLSRLMRIYMRGLSTEQRLACHNGRAGDGTAP
jgi:hypothetical protein